MQVFDIPIDERGCESTPHGTFGFPLAIYTTRIQSNVLGYVTWHWHPELQFCIVVNGQVEFSVNQETFLLGPGEGIFVNSGQLHMARNADGQDSTYACLDFDARLISSFAGSAVAAKHVNPYLGEPSCAVCLLNDSVAWQKLVLEQLTEVYEDFHGKEPDELQITILLSSVWRALVRHAFAHAETSHQRPIKPQVKEMLDYIGAHFAEPISLDDVARHVSLSKATCCRDFKAQLGHTLSEHILNIRLQHASRLLLTTDSSITDVALACGFGSSSYFIMKFRKSTGVSPAVWRKRQLAAATETLLTM